MALAGQLVTVSRQVSRPSLGSSYGPLTKATSELAERVNVSSKPLHLQTESALRCGPTLRRAIVRHVAIAAAVALACVVGLGVASDAGESEPTGPAPAEFTMDAVDEAAEAFARFRHEAGFAQTEVDYPNRRVLVWWKGKPSRAAKQAAASNPAGVSIEFRNARFSLGDATRGATTAFRTLQGLYGSGAVQSVAPAHDFSGLVVKIANGSSAAEDLDAVRSAVSKVTSLPSTAELAEPIVRTSRQDANAP